MKNIYKALAAFQQEVPVIHKGTTGYGYSYADLSEILGVVNPLLKKHGLGFTQIMTGISLRTVVFHIDSGETIESEVDIPQDVNLNGMNKFQVAGSAVTYYRRYSLSSILGLVTDVDSDASDKSNEAKFQKKNNRPAPKTASRASSNAPKATPKQDTANLASERKKTLTGLYKTLKLNDEQIAVKLRTIKTVKAADEQIVKLKEYIEKKSKEAGEAKAVTKKPDTSDKEGSK